MGVASSSQEDDWDDSHERSPDYVSDSNDDDNSPRRRRHRSRSGQNGGIAPSTGERPQRVSIGTTPSESRAPAIVGSAGRLLINPTQSAAGVEGTGTQDQRRASPSRLSAGSRIATTTMGAGSGPSPERVSGRAAEFTHSNSTERPHTLTLASQSQHSPQNLSDRSSSPGSRCSTEGPTPDPPSINAGTESGNGATITPNGPGLATVLGGGLGATSPTTELSGERNTDVQRSDVEPLPQGWTRRYVKFIYQSKNKLCAYFT